MALHNLRLLLFSCSLLISFHLGQSQLFHDVTPLLQPETEASPQSAPGPSPFQESAPVPGPAPVPAPSAEASPAPVPAPSSGDILVPTPAPSPEWASVPSPSPNADVDEDADEDFDAPNQDDSPVSPAPSPDVDPNLQEICNSTDHSSLCIATVAPLLQEQGDNITSVLEVAMKAGANLTELALSEVRKFAEQPENSPELNDILESCTKSYETALDSYRNALIAFPKHDKGTMNSMLSAVITFIGDCQDALAVSDEESPFSDIAIRLTNMTSNCLAIISRLD